jgi:hypothetical protein
VEPALSKVKSLRFATEAAITLLRIDDHIRSEWKRRRGKGRIQGARVYTPTRHAAPTALPPLPHSYSQPHSAARALEK